MRYCENCGKRLHLFEKHNCTGEPTNQASNSRIKPVLILSLLVVAAIVAVVLVIKPDAHKIDPFDYTTVSYEGYNGTGDVNIQFDISTLVSTIIGDEPSEFSVDAYAEWYEEYRLYADAIDYHYSHPTELKNGHEVVITFTVTGEAAKYVQSKEKTFIVEGLAETETYDAFRNVSVYFEGVSGEAIARINKNGEDPITMSTDFSIERSYGLSNGDTITVMVANAEELASKYHIIPEALTKVYSVSDLPTYITDASQIPGYELRVLAQDYLAYEIEQCQDTGAFTYTDIMIEGIYFLKRRDESWLVSKHALWIVVSCKEYYDGEFRDNVYFPLKFEDPILQANGETGYEWEDGSNATFMTGESFPTQSVLDDYYVTEIE